MPGAQAEQQQALETRGQSHRRRARAIGYPHHGALVAAILEELLDGVRQRRGLPQPAEDTLIVIEAVQQRGLIEGPLECAPHEGRDAGAHARDRRLGANEL